MRTLIAATAVVLALTEYAAAQQGAPRLVASESLGSIKIGQPAEAARAKMRSQPKAGPIAASEADSLYHQTLDFPSEGVSLDLVAEKSKGPQEVFSIKVTAPSKFATKAGIHVGSSRAEVTAAYKDDIDKELGDESHLVAGTSAGGLSFTFKKGKVSEIFMGQLAE